MASTATPICTDYLVAFSHLQEMMQQASQDELITL